MNQVVPLYHQLMALYGPQGWWPLLGHDGCNPTKTGSHTGYHPGRYDFPRNRHEQFEIILGAVLTQNTAWTSVERALNNLSDLHALTPEGLAALEEATLKAAIRPAGYYNQKAGYLLSLCKFFQELDGAVPHRRTLLAQRGIGPETADAMLLYAYGQPEFVVDAYTRRIVTALGWIDAQVSYDAVKALFEAPLEAAFPNAAFRVQVYQEYHALLVEHAKRFYSRKPYGTGCPLVEALGG